VYSAAGEIALLISCRYRLAISPSAATLLLHDRLLRLAQIVVGALQLPYSCA